MADPVLTLEQFHALPLDQVTPRHVVLGVRSLLGVPSLPVPEQGQVIVKMVLLSGGIGDYSVYIGAGSVEWVADHGHKLAFEVAALVFPGIEEARYRP